MAKTTEFSNIEERKANTTYGRVDEKGHWRPPYASEFSPLFGGGSLKAILKFFFLVGAVTYGQEQWSMYCLHLELTNYLKTISTISVA